MTVTGQQAVLCTVLTYISIGYSSESSRRPETTNLHIMDLKLLFWALRLLREDNSGMLGMGSQLSGVDRATVLSRKITGFQRHFSSKQNYVLEVGGVGDFATLEM